MKKEEKNNLIGFSEFLSLMKKAVKEAMGEGYKVEINHVIKNNSIELDGLVVLKENESVAPNIYLNGYYDKYLSGTSLKEMVEEIINIYKKSKNNVCNHLHIRYELSEMKSCIIYRLINYERNRKLLMNVPHIQFLDLAITFHCLVKNNEKGIGTIRITNEHMHNWNIDIDYLKKLARWNTPVLFPPVIRNMSDIILEMLQGKDNLSTLEYETEKTSLNLEYDEQEMYREILRDTKLGKANSMYVISNGKGINGASCLLYPDLIKNLAINLDADLYILPSSIHEIIAVKADGVSSKKGFREMVFEVNRTQVPEEDILSDNVYFYSRNRNAITL